MNQNPALQLLNGCELHVHAIGCLSAEDLLDLGQSIYQEMDWSLYIDNYQLAFGQHPEPLALFEAALNDGPQGLQRFRQQVIVSLADGGDFGRFQAKFNLIASIYRHWRQVLQQEARIMQQVVARHQQEGLDYVEYRSMFNDVLEDPEGFITFHRQNALAMEAAAGEGLTVRYLISLPRWAPLEGYELAQRMFDTHPELIPLIPGLDFCFFEEGYPPQTVQAFFQRLHADNQTRPERALEVAYHVGESYFDKSLESAVRWCHQVAQMGARRLGHAIALGLDPAIAVARRPQAHVAEPVNERLAQIDYDLEHRTGLAEYGVSVEVDALERERDSLQAQAADALVERPYSADRLAAVRGRQRYVLDCLAELGTVIETCPTSNLRIGGVPGPEHHPLHQFLESKVNLVIAADDPGIFDSPLAAETEWVLNHTNYDADSLVERLGDPRRFRFGQLRSVASVST